MWEKGIEEEKDRLRGRQRGLLPLPFNFPGAVGLNPKRQTTIPPNSFQARFPTFILLSQ